ncbi:unnamed protein product [Caenorhabditis nigoni]
MKFLPSLTAVLLVWITLNVVRSDDPLNKCEETVNYYREKAGLRKLEEDKQARAGLFEKVYRTCLTEDQVKNGIDGFTVTRFTEWDTIEDDFVAPKSILAPDVKTFVCIIGPRDCKETVFFAFMKKGVAG